MVFSVIVPSYNQDMFIGETFGNLRMLKSEAKKNGHEIEILLFDNCSGEPVQKIIASNKDLFNVIDISMDDGQFDAINKGIAKLTGTYWTWLNTDDLIDIDGFLKLADILVKSNSTIDYIYGALTIINEKSETTSIANATDLNLFHLINVSPGIFQPGSFFRKSFTDGVGQLQKYRCCFDYEYVLRILKNGGKLYKCDFTVAKFRLYSGSKSGSIVKVFIREQLEISKNYGRKTISQLGVISFLRLIKRFFVN